MALEIEGKWLVEHFNEGWAESASQIRQGYVAVDQNGRNVRVRQQDGRFTLTAKGKAEGGVKTEVEIELDDKQFEEFWALTEDSRLEKIRYRVPLLGFLAVGVNVRPTPTAEVDVFSGGLRGLILAEVEVSSRSVLDVIRELPPTWFGRDVTDDKNYSNAELSRLSEHPLKAEILGIRP